MASLVVLVYRTEFSSASATVADEAARYKKGADTSHIHLCRDMQPEERIARLFRGKLEKPILGNHGCAGILLRQLTSRKLGFGQGGPRIDSISIQVVQQLARGDAAGP
jgi:hypothetical protein